MAATQESRVEEAFELIKQGNEFEDSGEFWEASDAFCQAHEMLHKLSASSGGDDDEPPQENHESIRISQLYQQQALEYHDRARKCFVEALKAQVLPKSGAQTNEDVSLSDEEALSRIDLFAHLFSNPEVFSVNQGTIQEQQSSLEERLMQLNHSLPQGFKTSDERMRDINRGLNRLGLSSVYSEQQSHTTIGNNIDTNKSTSQQVDDIISQAKEEVALAGTTQDADNSSNVESDEDQEDNTDDLEDSDDSSTTSRLSGQVVESIRDKVANAQSSLAELMALLNDSIPDEDDDEDDVLVDRATIRKSLKQARLCLVQATKQLVDS